MALNCTVSPLATDGVIGATAIDTSGPRVTVPPDSKAPMSICPVRDP